MGSFNASSSSFFASSVTLRVCPIGSAVATGGPLGGSAGDRFRSWAENGQLDAQAATLLFVGERCGRIPRMRPRRAQGDDHGTTATPVGRAPFQVRHGWFGREHCSASPGGI
jgi:hypothetical protein